MCIDIQANVFTRWRIIPDNQDIINQDNQWKYDSGKCIYLLSLHSVCCSVTDLPTLFLLIIVLFMFLVSISFKLCFILSQQIAALLWSYDGPFPRFSDDPVPEVYRKFLQLHVGLCSDITVTEWLLQSFEGKYDFECIFEEGCKIKRGQWNSTNTFWMKCVLRQTPVLAP